MEKSNDPRYCFPKPISLSAFFGEGLSVWMGPIGGIGNSGERDVDVRSEGVEKIDLSKCIFETCLRTGEKSIKAEERLRRLKEEKSEIIRFGVAIFHGLWLDYQANVDKENSSLEWLFKTYEATKMDFMGTIIRYRGDFYRRTIYLSRNYEGKWDWGWGYLNGSDGGFPIIGCVGSLKP